MGDVDAAENFAREAGAWGRACKEGWRLWAALACVSLRLAASPKVPSLTPFDRSPGLRPEGLLLGRGTANDATQIAQSQPNFIQFPL